MHTHEQVIHNLEFECSSIIITFVEIMRSPKHDKSSSDTLQRLLRCRWKSDAQNASTWACGAVDCLLNQNRTWQCDRIIHQRCSCDWRVVRGWSCEQGLETQNKKFARFFLVWEWERVKITGSKEYELLSYYHLHGTTWIEDDCVCKHNLVLSRCFRFQSIICLAPDEISQILVSWHSDNDEFVLSL